MNRDSLMTRRNIVKGVASSHDHAYRVTRSAALAAIEDSLSIRNAAPLPDIPS